MTTTDSASTGAVATARAAGPDDSSGRVFSRALLLVALANSAFFIVHNSSFPIFPIYVKGRGGTEADVAVIVGMIGIISTISRPFSGWAIDVWGRRQMMIVGIVALAVSMAFSGFAVAIAMIGAFRILQGVAVGVFNTASQTYVADAAPASRRAETLGYVNTFQTMAASIGPTLAFALLTWPAALWLNSVATWWPGLDEGLLAEYSFAAFFILALAISVAGAVLLFFVPDGKKGGAPRKLSWASLAEPRAVLPMLLVTSSTVSFAGLLSFMPFFGPERGLDNIGLFFTVQALGVFLSGLMMGKVADRFGRYPVIVWGFFLSAVGMFLMAWSPNAAVLLFSGFFSGFVQGASRTAMAALTADRVPPERRGAALSTYAMGFDIGVGLGAPLLGFIVATSDIASAFFASGVIVLIGAIAAMFLLRPGTRAEA